MSLRRPIPSPQRPVEKTGATERRLQDLLQHKGAIVNVARKRSPLVPETHDADPTGSINPWMANWMREQADNNESAQTAGEKPRAEMKQMVKEIEKLRKEFIALSQQFEDGYDELDYSQKEGLKDIENFARELTRLADAKNTDHNKKIEYMTRELTKAVAEAEKKNALRDGNLWEETGYLRDEVKKTQKQIADLSADESPDVPFGEPPYVGEPPDVGEPPYVDWTPPPAEPEPGQG